MDNDMEPEELKPSLLKRQMRRDKRLGEEVIECYRRGWRTKQGKGYLKRAQQNAWEGSGSRESIKFRHGSGRRSQSDNLEPLIRFLRSHVGKHWDGVYSELCRSLDGKSMTGQHVLDHLKHFVQVKVLKEKGKLISLDGGRPHVIGQWYGRAHFYVHPKTGVLMEVKPGKKRSG
jgi:hypothetical protein